MKSLILLFGLAWFIIPIYGQENNSLSTNYIKSGTILHYRITIDDDSYPFIVKIVKLSMPSSIVFDYDMQSANRMQARIEMTSNALNNAQTFYVFFDGKDELLNNRVSMFLSKKNISEIENEKTSVNISAHTAMIKLDENENTLIPFTLIGKEEIYKTNIANLITQKISNNDLGYSIQYIKDNNCPIIVSMNLGWTITLERIE